MNELTPIQPGSLPDYLKQGRRLSLNAAAHANLQASFAVLKIRGKEWTVRYRGEEKRVEVSPGIGHDGKPLPVSAVQTLDVVIVGMAYAVSKRFYLAGYVDGSNQPPDCLSIDGVSPDPASPHKQNNFCATCQQNMWGSTTTAAGRKAKACRDGRRIAVVPAGDEANEGWGGPMLLDIPPTSLTVLDSYVTFLERQGADVSEVITRLSFRPGISHPELVFDYVNWLPDQPTHDLVMEHSESDQVHRMLNEEVESVTYDPQAEAGLGPRPAHLQAQPQPAAPQPQPVVQTQPAAPRLSPFAQAAVARAQSQPPARPPAQPQAQAPIQAQAQPDTPAPPAATPVSVVQGAPPDMSEAIDKLLN